MTRAVEDGLLVRLDKELAGRVTEAQELRRNCWDDILVVDDVLEIVNSGVDQIGPGLVSTTGETKDHGLDRNINLVLQEDAVHDGDGSTETVAGDDEVVSLVIGKTLLHGLENFIPSPLPGLLEAIMNLYASRRVYISR